MIELLASALPALLGSGSSAPAAQPKNVGRDDNSLDGSISNGQVFGPTIITDGGGVVYDPSDLSSPRLSVATKAKMAAESNAITYGSTVSATPTGLVLGAIIIGGFLIAIKPRK